MSGTNCFVAALLLMQLEACAESLLHGHSLYTLSHQLHGSPVRAPLLPPFAGFLIQLTAVVTPLLSTLAGEVVTSRTLTAAVLALGGTILISLDGAPVGVGAVGECRADLV